MINYDAFLRSKSQLDSEAGFKPIDIPSFLFDFQKVLVEKAIRKGRFATLADTGLGKTPMELVWADNVVRHTNRPVLLMTHLAITRQTEEEAHKFGIDAKLCRNGKFDKTQKRVIITNYDQLKHFDCGDFDGVIGDDASILKNFEGALKAQITEFMRLMKYRALYTATPAPNDFIELGTLSECLGDMGYMDMLGKFFKNDQNSLHPTSGRGRFENGLMTQNKWRFRGHAEQDFWRWVCSWARACRKPSDLGFDDGDFILPPLTITEHAIMPNAPRPGFLIPIPAVGLKEQNAERRHTIQERCEKAASMVVATKQPAVCWAELNPEADLIESLVPDSVQVAGHGMSDEEKEEKFEAFRRGDAQARVMVTKKKIAAFGLNWQHCAHQTSFPGHSYEQFYQAIKRSHRFGQKRPVQVDLITSEGSIGELANLRRKHAQAETMFTKLVSLMNDELKFQNKTHYTQPEEVPSWLCSIN